MANDAEKAADDAIQSVIWFFLADPRRITKALMTHRKGEAGLCRAHTEVWPCLVHRLAERAHQQMHMPPIPTQRKASP